MPPPIQNRMLAHVDRLLELADRSAAGPFGITRGVT